jgi:branched-chain amino acid transport system ATP-binding protein
MGVVLSARGLTTGYGSQAVIRDLNIEVSAGEVATLLGANGAGKTTTIRALSGLLPLHSGSANFEGSSGKAALYKRARNGMALVTEERSVFKSLSCHDNLRVGGVDVEAVLELFPELEKRMSVAAGLLSGGEQQMLTLGRAIARRPRLLLADELSLGLAPLIVDRLLKAVRSTADTHGTAVLLVEQHARKAIKYADRVYVMRRGTIEMTMSAVEAEGRIGEVEAAYISSEARRGA